ncbi:hypothetical protein BV98_000609 [Sphingobium herbicidovorans NBRC 16415]|uniref:Rhamnosyl transferase n=1 Tax=Sphingobium herbicidovorans (strain ATCC 700291 / DSM 11019 / CCUG 56400 / KCTC 2939 / LMG 18315 / NBRC 16415 / MH) TaxID=1219045 RepID=A0A086PED3_SPHHM|nr:glycosyltransferase [Sphingobium herbicidovorans]KFG91751.1 hypothetical protein BV98_000609 [Sphingobium herbicidovorans NBRC 16415]
MKMVYIIIRYSIISKVNKAWIVSRSDFVDYENHLFSKERMKERENLFSTHTLPSLKNMIDNKPDDIDVKVMIFTSSSMPSIHKEFLYNLCHQDHFRIIDVDIEEDYIKAMENYLLEEILSASERPSVYATVRLDDDDALSQDFLHQMSPYINRNFDGFCLSFSRGYRGFYSNGRLKGYQLQFNPMIGLGLALVSSSNSDGHTNSVRTIYSVGDHKKVDRKSPVILDSRYPAYIVNIHEHSDMSQKDKDRINKGKDYTEFDEVKKYFPHISLKGE